MSQTRIFMVIGILLGLAATGTALRGQDQDLDRMVIHADQREATISPEIYGQFAEHLGHCIYGGLWVGEDSPIPNTRGIRNDVLEALKKLNIPVLRWPGGCFADEYHWRDGIGPRNERRPTVNTHWGMVTESNQFGTHEFMDLCEQLGCEAYIAGNVGSGTVQEMQDWIEYMTFGGDSTMANLRRQNGRDKPWKVKYFGVGNENWGCGGQMTPEHYSDVFRRYQNYVWNYSGNRITKVACGASSDDFNWTEAVMKGAARFMDAISLHHYVLPGNWSHKGSATDFGEAEWFAVLEKSLYVDDLIRRHLDIMDRYDPRKRVALVVDEWGTWYDPEPGRNSAFLYQQNTLRDALAAGVFLNIFNSHCDRVKMANIAQMVNVLQSMVLTEGPKMIVTPTYHVFEMYKVHQGATLLPSTLDCRPYQYDGNNLPSVSASASVDNSNRIHVTVCNLDPHRSAGIALDIRGFQPRKASGRVLTASTMDARNTFESPDAVKPAEVTGIEVDGSQVRVQLPPKSVSVLELAP